MKVECKIEATFYIDLNHEEAQILSSVCRYYTQSNKEDDHTAAYVVAKEICILIDKANKDHKLSE